MLCKPEVGGEKDWPSAVVFDLDGTLVDSSGDIMASLNELLASRKLAPFSVDRVLDFVGGGIAALVERAFKARNIALSADELPVLVALFHSIYSARLIDLTKTYAGALDVIVALKARGVRIGLCTNKTEDLARGIVEGLGLGKYFDAIVGGGPGRPLKPSPIPLFDTLAHLGVAAPDAVMVGDSGADVKCARAAGVAIIGVSFGYSRIPMKQLGADVTIDSYAEFDVACDSLRTRLP